MAPSIPSVRGEHPVLVPDAEERLAVAVIRSLGRAGYPVHAASSRRLAMGFGSRFAARAARCPDYRDDAYLPWLRDYCAQHRIRCIVPGEDLLLAIRPDYASFAPLLVSRLDAGPAMQSISKYALFRALAEAPGEIGANLPPLRLIDADPAIAGPSVLADLPVPIFVKTDAVHAREPGAGGGVDRNGSVEEAFATVRRRLLTHDRVVAQGHVPGVGVGAFLMRWDGKIIARFMHRRLHELPGSGWSSYRTSWWHDAIVADAEQKLEYLDFNGVAMLEYRWDPQTDRFSLLEMNARFWGSLHLALYAGVDFPRLLVDAFFGTVPASVVEASREVRCRNFALELRYLAWRLRDPALGFAQKWREIAGFVRTSMDRDVRSDLWFPGDRRVFWLHLRQALLDRPS